MSDSGDRVRIHLDSVTLERRLTSRDKEVAGTFPEPQQRTVVNEPREEGTTFEGPNGGSTDFR